MKKIIYFAFIHSQLNYEIELYGNCYQIYLNKLVVLNNKILHILQNVFQDSKVVDLYNNCNTLTLRNQHKFNILLFVHKFFHRRYQLPQNFFIGFMTISLVNGHSGRRECGVSGCRSVTFALYRVFQKKRTP